MKILKIVANNFKLCSKDFTISFMPTGNKMPEHKEYDLHEIDEKLFVFSTMGVIGKNASGKTTVVDLLHLVYDIFHSFTVKFAEQKFLSWNKTVSLDITFYNEGYLYRYITDIKPITNTITSTVEFLNQKLYRKKYLPTYHNQIFNYDKYDLLENNENLPKNTSIIFNVLKNSDLYAIIYTCDHVYLKEYQYSFNILKALDDSERLVELIIKMFDEYIDKIEFIKDNKYKIFYTNKKTEEVSNVGLYERLSKGTTKGFDLYTYVTYSLKFGLDLVIDEIENHFHKNLVINLINLYKDKAVNKNNATLIFTTHYPELLDTFARQDNIYIVKREENIIIENMYKYDIRNDLLKSKKFLDNVFGTNVDYQRMMDFKKELMK